MIKISKRDIQELKEFYSESIKECIFPLAFLAVSVSLVVLVVNLIERFAQ